MLFSVSVDVPCPVQPTTRIMGELPNGAAVSVPAIRQAYALAVPPAECRDLLSTDSEEK